MPYRQPPRACPGTPRRVSIGSGERWFRVGEAGRALAFKYFPPSPFRGGRFDSLSPNVGHCYISSTECTAVYEAVLRDEPFDSDGHTRVVAKARIEGRDLAEVHAVQPLELVRLQDLDDLAEIGQEDDWLLRCDAREYPATREWGEAIRSWVPSAHGIAWKPRFGSPEWAAAVFVDLSKAKAAHVPLRLVASCALLNMPARGIIDDCLESRRATIGP
jgi:hypothetical protein